MEVEEKMEDILKDLKDFEIENRSMNIIEKEVDLSGFSPIEKEIVKRVIHATADFEYKDTIKFHPDAISLAIENLKKGKDILVDVEMVKAGISKRLLSKSKVICYLEKVRSYETTRTEKAIELALNEEKNIGIVAIGNAPTALLKAIDIFKRKNIKDVVLIGLPVGFINAYQAKVLLSKQGFPYITNLSRKGGSPATSAIINALLKLKELVE